MRQLEGLDVIREKVRERDNFKCRECNKAWVKGKRRFDVHHLDEKMESVRNYAYDKANQDKMITLCHKCHLNLHGVRDKISNALNKYWNNHIDLEARLKKVLAMRRDRYKLKEIGQAFGFSRERARQLVNEATARGY